MHTHPSRLIARSQGQQHPVAPFVASLRRRARLRSTPVRVTHSHALTPRAQHRCSLVSAPPPLLPLHQQRLLCPPPARKARCAVPRLLQPTHQPGRAGPLARSLLCQRRQLAFRPHPASAHCPVPSSESSAHSGHPHQQLPAHHAARTACSTHRAQLLTSPRRVAALLPRSVHRAHARSLPLLTTTPLLFSPWAPLHRCGGGRR
jgi:hypothetical protein